MKKLKLFNLLLIANFMIFLMGIFWVSSLVAEQQKNQKIIDQILTGYTKKGAKEFNPQQGFELWNKNFTVKGKQKNCTDCHTTDLLKQGKHVRSGKIIKPMAAWTQPNRYTKIKKVEKWFKRNCKSTWGRECTPQEKGDFLAYLRFPFTPKSSNQN